MSYVFVLDALKQPLSPAHPARARLLLTTGKASVFRTSPFTIILKRQVEHPAPAPLRLKIDPGAQTTGLALLDEMKGQVVWAAELSHRGERIKQALDTRRAVRRSRRCRKTRYRAPRWANRRRKKGWLPPSLCSRVENIFTWVSRISRIAHVTALSQELVRFDLQKLENPEITGVQYQLGRVAVRARGAFNITTKQGKICDVPHRFCQLIGRSNGYSYQIGERLAASAPTSPFSVVSSYDGLKGVVAQHAYYR